MLKLFNERVAAYSYGTGVLLQFDDMQMDNTSVLLSVGANKRFKQVTYSL